MSPEYEFGFAQSTTGRYSLYKKFKGRMTIITIDLMEYQARDLKRALEQAFEAGRRTERGVVLEV